MLAVAKKAPMFLRFEIEVVVFAVLFIFATIMPVIPANTAMMVITTRSSTKVNPFLGFVGCLFAMFLV